MFGEVPHEYVYNIVVEREFHASVLILPNIHYSTLYYS